MRLPDRGVCRITSALNLKAGVDITGGSKFWSAIEVCGAGVKGLLFTPAVLTGFEAKLSHFSLQGCDQTVGTLIEIWRAGRVYLEDLYLFRTGGNGIALDSSIEVNIRNVVIQQYSNHGIVMSSALGGPNAVVSIEGVSIQSSGVVSQAAIALDGVHFVSIRTSTLEGYADLGGPFFGTYGLLLDGVSSFSFTESFMEHYEHAVVAAGAASTNVAILRNHLHDSSCDTDPDNITIDFNQGGLAHTGIQVISNKFVQCSTDIAFHPGASTNWEFQWNERSGPGGVFLPITTQPSQMVNRANPLHHQGHLKITDAFEPANTDAEVSRIVSWFGPLDYGATPAGECEDEGIGGIVGIHEGDPCFVGATVTAAGTDTGGVSYSCFVSFADNGVGPTFGAVAVRRCNSGASPAPTLTDEPFKFVIIKTVIPPNPG
jgi:hypothetical protein